MPTARRWPICRPSSILWCSTQTSPKSTKTATFQKVCPARFVNCGIAETNMMGIAAGIASTGRPVFASTFAMFAAGRAYDAVRNGIAYPHLNVKIAATHAGLSVGEDGATHQCIEDIALMRVIPGMVVCCPADGPSTTAAVRAALQYDGPVYLRLGRLGRSHALRAGSACRFHLRQGVCPARGRRRVHRRHRPHDGPCA